MYRIFMLIVVASMLAGAAQAGPYFARGSYYAGTGDIWNADAGNEMFDDGLHGDDTAGDGIYGCYVTADQDPGYHEWKIATVDWTENYPNNIAYPTSNAVMYYFDPGEVIHFRLDTNQVGEGWQPASFAVACSHFCIDDPGIEFELIGSPPELGAWLAGVPIVMDADLWHADITIAAPGVHEFKFRVVDTWDVCNIGRHYNMFIGDNFVFETVDPDTPVRFEFNLTDGRARGVPAALIPVESMSWSRMKAAYR